MTQRPFFEPAAAMALAFLASGCGWILSSPVEQAQAAYEAQDYATARDHTLAALQADENDAEALALLARIQIAMGAGGEALATIERLSRTNSPPVDLSLLKAEVLLQTGEATQALRALEGENSAESWRLRALAHAASGDAAAANAEFLRGREAEGDKRKLYTAEANYHLDRGDADAARYAVGQVQQIAPDTIETLFVSARLAELDRRPDLASRAYLAILDIAPTDRPALLGAIHALDELGRVDLIRDLIAKGRVAYPQDFEFVYLLASLHALEANWTAVRDTLQAREADLAGHEDARGLYGRSLLELGQPEQARALLEPLNRRYPGNAAYARVYARILLDLGDKSGAGRVMRPILAGGTASDEDRAIAARAAV